MNMNYGMPQMYQMNPSMMMGMQGGMGVNGMGMGMGMGSMMGFQGMMGLTGMMMGGNGYGNVGFGGFGGGFYGMGQMANQYGGGSYGMGQMANQYGGGLLYHKAPVFNEKIHHEAIYKTVTEQQEHTTNDPGMMWDVFFDYEAGQKTKTRSPIILDLNGNGKPDITGSNILGNGKVEGKTVLFDIDPTHDSWQYESLNLGSYYEKNAKTWGKGEWVDDPRGKNGKVYKFGNKEPREKTEWLVENSGDGFLVWDVDGDGKITSSKELFGNYDIDGKEKFEHGYEKLALHFDKDGNGIIEGDELEGLQIWMDDNADGITDEGELRSLAEFGITSLDIRNIDKKDMSATFNREKTEYKEVTNQVLEGYNTYITRELAGYEERYGMNYAQMGGMMGMMGMGQPQMGGMMGYGMPQMGGMMGYGQPQMGMMGMMGMGQPQMGGMMGYGQPQMGGYDMMAMMAMMGMGGYGMMGMMGMGGYGGGMMGMMGMGGQPMYAAYPPQQQNWSIPSPVGFQGFGGINGNGLAGMQHVMAQNGFYNGGGWF